MEQIKRSPTDLIIDNNHKRFKFNVHPTLFEHFPNEILYEIFEYLDIIHAYNTFFNLNIRFQNLFLYSNLSIQVDISSMTKSTFEQAYEKIIIPNQHRINYLRLSNPFTVDLIFSPPRVISKFIRLQSLVLDQIKAKYLENIFIQLSLLSHLQSLSIDLIDRVKNPTLFYLQIFRLPKLKYCRMKFDSENNRESLLLIPNETSSIEHLVIKNYFQYQSFNNLFDYLPRLRYLSIDCVECSSLSYIDPSPIILKDLKYVSLKFNLIRFDELEKLVKNFFRSIEHLRLTSRYDPTYLDAQRWENLITSHMPNLRIFDLNNDSSPRFSSLSYHESIKEFSSSFWTTRKWFFTHQHNWQVRLDCGILHSTEPYRRKDYTFHWDFDEHHCSNPYESNLDIVEHVRIDSKHASTSSGYYFPNARELTLKTCLTTPDTHLATALNRILPVQQLTKLNFEYIDCPFERIVDLIRFTPYLHTLKISFLSISKKSMQVLQQNPIFQEVSLNNRIKNIEINHQCSFERIQMLVTLFFHVEYFKIGMKRKEVPLIFRYLFSKTSSRPPNLFYLCISHIPQVCLGEVKLLLTLEGLLDDYAIKLIRRNLYLWW